MENNENLIDLTLYKLFYLVYQNGSFSKTAKLLNISQPSISYNIKKLEDELGVDLFERGNGLVMTPEAEELFPYVEKALNILRDGERKITDLINMKKGQIVIGIPSHIGVFLLTDILKRFSTIYPNIKVEVICKSTKELFKLLSISKLDILIDCSPLEEDTSEFVVKRVSREKCALACNCKDIHLLNKKVSIDDILKMPLITPLRTSGSTKSLMKVFKKYKIDFEPRFEIATSDMIAEMVDQEMGIGFLFEKTIEKYPNLRKIDMDIILPEFDIFLLYKDYLLSTTAQEFIRFMNKNSL